MSRPLSVVIPTLNAAATLPATLVSLNALDPSEIVISDGGSTDSSVTIAIAHDGKHVLGPAGRGGQLALGAEEAAWGWLLFLHADTVLSEANVEELKSYIAFAGAADRAAVFALAFDDNHWAARLIERLANWRSRALGLPYGDQGLLISRKLYDAVGGYRNLPLMEDVDLVRRIGRRRLHFFNSAVTTSAVRYRRDGWLRRPLRNLTCLGLYFLGVSPERLVRLYR